MSTLLNRKQSRFSTLLPDPKLSNLVAFPEGNRIQQRIRSIHNDSEHMGCFIGKTAGECFVSSKKYCEAHHHQKQHSTDNRGNSSLGSSCRCPSKYNDFQHFLLTLLMLTCQITVDITHSIAKSYINSLPASLSNNLL